MSFKRILFLCLIAAFSGNIVYAEGLASRQEAINYYNEGVAAQKKGDYEKAFKEYKMSLMLSAEFKKSILHNEGVIFANRGDMAQAAARFQEVLKLDPNFMPAKLNLGLIYDTHGDRCKSLEYWSGIFNFERLKPKGFILEDEKQAEKDNF